ncbi:hypothetical protein RND81_05G222100 [Saponaria officinalis]|uniref:Pentatricopeptide repeat-containing protein n=1 Tax=Saponaria officinalis TaxID=3572 RepID=A0AAW1KV33_SAPOF
MFQLTFKKLHLSKYAIFFFNSPQLLLNHTNFHSFSSPLKNDYIDNKFTDYPSSRTNLFDKPTSVSYSIDYASLLRVCIKQRAFEPGKQIHARLCVSGEVSNVILATKLVDLYCNCSSLAYAHHLFDEMPKRNLFLWNVLIRGYAWDGPYDVAISLYRQLIEHGLVPDNFTFPFVLKACSSLSNVMVGRDIHEHVVRSGWEKDVFVGAALIDMYAKCGCVESARVVFDKIVCRDVVLWNSMLAAYAHNGHPEDALCLCSQMAFANERPTVATLVTVISASADIAALPQGREIHGFCLRQGFGSQDKVLTALVDLYAKCGSVGVARRLFETLRDRRVVDPGLASLMSCSGWWAQLEDGLAFVRVEAAV